MFQTEVVEKIKLKHTFLFNNVFRKSCSLWDNVEKNCRAGQATDDNMAHAHCMLDALVYKHTLRIRNTAFPLQQWSHERTSMLRYTYIACIVWNIRGKFGADPKAFWIL